MEIDVLGVAANGLWIVGLASILAMSSWAHWMASREGTRFRDVSNRPKVQRTMSVGMILICVGLATTAQSWWERALWVLLAVAWAMQIVLGLMEDRTP